MKQHTGLPRIAHLYRRMEQMQMRQMQRAQSCVLEAVAKEHQAAAANAEVNRFGMAALARGRREEQAIARLAGELGRHTALQLQADRLQAEKAVHAARKLYSEARLQSEQIAALLERASEIAAEEARRREQNEMDDRFASQHRRVSPG